MNKSTRPSADRKALDPARLFGDGNGQEPIGDAAEPDGPADTRFDPATLDAPAEPVAAPQPPAPGPTPDLFADLSQLRLSQDFASSVGVKKALLTVPVRKPAKEWFIRCHPDLRIETCVVELKEDREVYLVAPALWPELAAESTFGPRALYAAMNRQAVLFVWPIRLPGPDGKIDDWNRSALEAAAMAETRWVRVLSNMALGAYDVFEATADWPEPEWPDVPFNELLRVAFKGRVIDSLDHPVLRRLRGEA
jgi:hypothetical protein